MAMPVSSARDLPEARRGGACRRSLAARAEELNRHSPDCQVADRRDHLDLQVNLLTKQAPLAKRFEFERAELAFVHPWF